jgi:hypothetical protein
MSKWEGEHLSQPYCRNLTLKECEDETHTLEMGIWESSGTPKILEFNCRDQNTLHRGVLYIIGKISKCRCRKWVCMSHLHICSTSYGKKKGRESNWQFDSPPLKIKNRPNPNACRWSETHCWKALNESYNCFRPRPNRRSKHRVIIPQRWESKL